MIKDLWETTIESGVCEWESTPSQKETTESDYEMDYEMSFTWPDPDDDEFGRPWESYKPWIYGN